MPSGARIPAMAEMVPALSGAEPLETRAEELGAADLLPHFAGECERRRNAPDRIRCGLPPAIVYDLQTGCRSRAAAMHAIESGASAGVPAPAGD